MICAMCRRNDFLCSACGKMVKDGQITALDVKICQALEKMGVQGKFTRTIEDEKKIVIVAGKDSSKIIGKGGRVVKKLTEILGKSVDVVESGSEKEMAEKMIRAPVLGVNKVYGQEEKYKIRVDKRFKTRAWIHTSLLEQVLGKKVDVVFE